MPYHAVMSRAEILPLVGGALCLDFANTLEWRRTAHPEDALASYADLVRWGVRAGALGSEEVGATLQEHAERAPAAARAVLARAIAWREALHRALSAVAADGAASDRLLDDVLRPVIPLLTATRFTVHARTVHRRWRGVPDDLEHVLWPIAWSVHDLLLGEDLPRVRECGNADCHWLFVDRSRNRSRRWCGMTICGNVEKARRFRRRHAAG
jgi:predicted RNA-binding Zn ribbon-like protein